MKSVLNSIISDKKILILGFGREGKSSLKTILEAGCAYSVTVSDSRDVSAELPDGVGCICGDKYMDCLDEYDVVFKSPGIVLSKDINEYKCKITSQVEIFITAYRDRIVGITGTKGKSTTSSLLNHVLKTAGKKVLFAGNIGIPVFDINDQVETDSVIVLELSCHQLEFINTAPHRAVLLNIYEDHLDHYGTREKYARSKMNIYLNQNPGDFLYTTEETFSEIIKAPSEVVLVDCDSIPLKSFSECKGASLRGKHNILNAAFVYTVAKEYGVDYKTFLEALCSFETLPHRLQFVCTKDGIDYYDDSISTTVKSAISAVESIDNAAVLLVGGMERNIRYEELRDYLLTSKLKCIVCMYESGKRFFEMYTEANKSGGNAPEIVLTENLEEAVKTAKSKACKNDAVLLSPAAASYGYFKNFEERGDVFQNLVKND